MSYERVIAVQEEPIVRLRSRWEPLVDEYDAHVLRLKLACEMSQKERGHGGYFVLTYVVRVWAAGEMCLS